jgi:ATP-dependent Lon protease
MDENSKNTTAVTAGTEETEEIIALEKQLEEADLPDDLHARTSTMVSRLRRVAKYGYFSREYEPIAKYVSWITQIPWGKFTKDNLDLANAKRQLDETHFGLNQVKERIMEYIAILHLQRDRHNEEETSNVTETGQAVPTPTQANKPNQVNQVAPSNINPVNQMAPSISNPIKQEAPATSNAVENNQQQQNLTANQNTQTQTQPQVAQAPAVVSSSTPQVAETTLEKMVKLEGSSAHAPIICLVGVQGIGKTSIAKSISMAMGRKFVRISLGGIAHVSELRGTSRSEIDSEPGQVVKALIRTEVMNPLILMDEIDKVSDFGGVRADVMATLLEILDPEQNATFRDYYVDYPVDLSKVMFVCTANNLGGISAALLDRLEIVRMSSYTDEEKSA